MGFTMHQSRELFEDHEECVPPFKGRHVICERAVTPSLLATLFPFQRLSQHFNAIVWISEDQRLQVLISLAQ
jgi:hypothetical protein